MEILFTPEGIIALLTLTILEIVLGIDNVIFIGILAGKLPKERQPKARSIGIGLALALRVVFLIAASWIAQLTTPLVVIPAFVGMEAPFGVTGRDIIMFGGGLFLLYKGTTELHEKLEGGGDATSGGTVHSFASIVLQIAVLDIVFSIDSVITAIGMTSSLAIMIVAVVISMIVMQLSASRITDFIANHPTIKILALSFLLMVGLVLIMEGFHAHVPKGYVYFAMAFSVSVEFLNMRYRRKSEKPVSLHSR